MSVSTSSAGKSCDFDSKSHNKECECDTCKSVLPKKREFVEVDRELAEVWIREIKSLDTSGGVKAFKTNILPFSRVKKIMKANQEVKMVSAETAFVLTKACEFFLVELTRLSWVGTVQHKRKTLLNVDTHQAILQTECFDFLVDVIDGTIALEQESARQKRSRQPVQPNSVVLSSAEIQQNLFDARVLHQQIPAQTQPCIQGNAYEQLPPGSYSFYSEKRQ